MAIGATGAVVAMPLLIHSPWTPFTHAFTQAHGAGTLIRQTEFAIAAIAGSVVPDLDEAHSLLARKVEHFVQYIALAAIVAVCVIFHLLSSLGAWIFVGMVALLLLSRANFVRKVALGLLAASSLAAAAKGLIPVESGVLLALWFAGAMLTGHRTFTHSLAGIGIYGIAISILGHHFGVSTISVGLILGYALHMAADAVSGGVPLLWPIRTRIGVGLVRTGRLTDHLIGVVATLVFVANVIS
jgi:inner membrane protein